MKCLVKGCTNHSHEGIFIGELCKPCHIMLSEGKVSPSTAWFVEELLKTKEKVGVKETFDSIYHHVEVFGSANLIRFVEGKAIWYEVKRNYSE